MTDRLLRPPDHCDDCGRPIRAAMQKDVGLCRSCDPDLE